MIRRNRCAVGRSEAGLTLIELMISLLLAGILSAGLFYMMAGQTATYTRQMGSVSLQENLWGAMEYVQRQLRSAGFGFAPNCPGGRVERWDKVTGTGCGTVPSRLVGFQAFNDCNLLETAIGSCPDGSGVDSFVVTSATALGDGTRLRDDASSASGGSLRLTAAGGIQPNDLILLSSASTAYCTVVKAMDDPDPDGPGVFDLSITGDGEWNPGPGCRLFPPSAGGYKTRQTLIGRLPSAPVQIAPRYFAIDRSRNAPRLVSWMTMNEPSADRANMETVAQGIEDLQVAFACDENGNYLLEEGASAADRGVDEWAFNVASEVTQPACNPARIGMIRVTLIARSDGADPDLQTGFRPAAEDRAAGTPAEDKIESGEVGTYSRRLLTTLVRPRNL